MDHNIHCSSREICPLEHASAAFQSFDTVRALHQSVLCLRAALENAHKEIDDLKKQISIQSDIKEGKQFRASLEEIIGKQKTEEDIIPDESKKEKEKCEKTIAEEEPKTEDTTIDQSLTTKKKSRKDHYRSETHTEKYDFSKSSFVPNVRIVTNPSSSNKRRSQMASKIDVKIKLSSNVKVDGSSSGATDDSNSNSGSDGTNDSEQADEKPENSDSVITIDNKDTANNVSEDIEPINIEKQLLNEELEEKTETIIEKSENTEDRTKAARNLRQSTGSSDANEEVDDIELIFSSDDKEHLQEDLVSISDYEPWEKTGSAGTPVLVNFGALSSSEELNTRFKKMDAGEEINMETEQENIENDICIKRNESVDTFEQVENNTHTSGLGRRWTNHNVLIETDISKCGIVEENILDMGRRNTCPNPPVYRPIMHRETLAQSRHSSTRCPLAVKFSRNSRTHYHHSNRSTRPILHESNKCEPKRSSSAQTEISALPEHWQSESNLISDRFGDGFYTLPSKFVPPPSLGKNRRPSQMTDKTQEARRVMLSDINFTSMVPELSRSADHLCQDDEYNGNAVESTSYYKGSHLRTPDGLKGMTPSASMTSPGVSQWTVNENSFGTQTTQTDNYWNGDSFDSSKSYSMGGSRLSTILNKSYRSRSVPSFQCSICKQNHSHNGIRASESMHYTPRVTFREPNSNTSVRGSLPDLRNECTCMQRRYVCGQPSLFRLHGYSSGSTESLLDEADDFLNKSVDGMSNFKDDRKTNEVNRRRSENDIKRDYSPSKQSLPFLPKSPKCLKLGHLAKVITKTGRVVIGRVRYIGPLASSAFGDDESFVGLQLPNSFGDCDGTIDGRRFFDCEPQHGIFVPFKKIVMAWSA